MKIALEHSTTYRYDDAVCLEPHTFRLRPRMNSTQRLLAFEIQILPVPTGTTECLDQDGNLALYAWFRGSTLELNVFSRFCVELVRENPFDFVLGGESLSLPLWYSEPLCAALVPYRNYTHIGEAVKQFANSVAASTQWNALLFLANLNSQLFQSSRHVIRPEGPPWPSTRTLSLREGSCRDMAILFCDVCRAMGIATRFVSGYECAAVDQQDSYMHAWAEVYLPSIGWRGYDPSRGLAVARTHVAVAAGFDYDLAAPIAGLYRGGSGVRMEASIRMRADPAKDELA